MLKTGQLQDEESGRNNLSSQQSRLSANDKRKIDLLMDIFKLQTTICSNHDTHEPHEKVKRTSNSTDVHSTVDVDTKYSNNSFQNFEQFHDALDDQDWFNGISNTCVQSLDSDFNDDKDEQDEKEDKQFRKEIKKLKKAQKNETFLRRNLSVKTNITNGEIILMCMLLGMRHSLSWTAILDIIDMVNKLFDKDIVDITKYKLLNYFPENQDWYRYHIYCTVCKSYIGKRTELTEPVFCPSCKEPIKNLKNAPYFLTLDVKSQLKELFENPLIQPHLEYRQTRKKNNSQNIEDVYDGYLYKQLSSEGNILHEKWNFSYVFNCDGCKAMDTSPLSIWPVYLKINELPPSIRNKNLILVGLWAHNEKPTMNTFLKPIVDEFNDLSCTGISWNLKGIAITSKIIPLCCSVDSPCRCSMLNMKQYNGFYGCTFCLHPTTSVNKQRKYTIDEVMPAPRTHEGIIDAMKASRVFNQEKNCIETHTINGVKGPSILMQLIYFHLVYGMSVESLHALFLGIILQYTEIILSKVGKPYYVGSPEKLSLINQRLLSIKVPGVITRAPRSLEFRSCWRANEWRSWAQHYMLPCLEGILPDEYLITLSKLVITVNILLQESISPESLDLAHKLSVQFVKKFQEDFGEEQMTYNVHLFLHVVQSVHYLGPIYLHDAFCFENENRLILGLKTSPTKVAVQIAKRFMFYRQIPRFSANLSIGPRVMEFVENFEHRVKSCIEVNKIYLIGAGKQHVFDDMEQKLGFHGEALRFEKIIHKHVRYTTASYSENLQKNDSIIETIYGVKGVIKSICYTKECEIIIFYNQFIIKDNFRKMQHLAHIHEYSVDQNVYYCRPFELKKQCIVYDFNGKKYLCEIARGCYED